MLPVAQDLVTTIERAVAEFARVPQHTAAEHPAPGKWSALQILGHLVDSAANNHQRFVRGQFQNDMVFQGYDQDQWVAAQDWSAARWTDVVTLWAAYNRHLARVFSLIPDAIRLRPHTQHNMHEIASAHVEPGAPVTLDWFFGDYCGHLRHHLRQIDGLLGTNTG